MQAKDQLQVTLVSRVGGQVTRSGQVSTDEATPGHGRWIEISCNVGGLKWAPLIGTGIV